MEIKVIPVTPEKRKPKPLDESKLGFGKIFTDHFFTLPYSDGHWHAPPITPGGLMCRPGACACRN